VDIEPTDDDDDNDEDDGDDVTVLLTGLSPDRESTRNSSEIYPGPVASSSPNARILRREGFDEKVSKSSRSGCRDSLFFSRNPVMIMMIMIVLMMMMKIALLMIMMLMEIKVMMLMLMVVMLIMMSIMKIK